MIVDTIAGLAEPTELLGCPYRGITIAGELPLPGGRQKAYPVRVPQQGGAIGLSRVIRPPWAKAKELPKHLQQKGLSLQPYATINGWYSSIYGAEMGKNNWLWAEAPGRVWLVDASELTSPIDLSGKTFKIHLKRFGWIGGIPPDRQMQRTITVQHFSTPTLTGEVEESQEPYIFSTSGEKRILWYTLADTHPLDGHSALFVIGQGYLRTLGVALIDLRAQTLTLLAGDEVWHGIERCEGDCQDYLGQRVYTYDVKAIHGAGFSPEGKPKVIVSRTYHKENQEAHVVKEGSPSVTLLARNISGGIALQSIDGDVYDERSVSSRGEIYTTWYGSGRVNDPIIYDGTGLFGESLDDIVAYINFHYDRSWAWCNALFGTFETDSPKKPYAVSYLPLSENMVALVKHFYIVGPEFAAKTQIIKVWRCGHPGGKTYSPPIEVDFGLGPHSWLSSTFSSDPMTGDIMASAEGVIYRV